MSFPWWQLPGPRAFIFALAQELREGKNLVLRLPSHLPGGLKDAVRSILYEDRIAFETLYLRGSEEGSPIEILFQRYAQDISEGCIWNVETLLELEWFHGKIIWIEGMTDILWTRWNKFIQDYEPACRARPLLQRTLFCIPLSGAGVLECPAPDICLSVKKWIGIVGAFDMVLYAYSLFLGVPMTTMQKKIAVAMTSALALWDPEVADRMVCERYERIIEPLPILQEVALKRGWANNCTDVCKENQSLREESLWASGCHDLFEGSWKLHSSVIAASGVMGEITNRVWSAQVGVLLPYVEERRKELLPQISKYLKVPFKTRFGEIIDDVRDLEIGHIDSQLYDHRGKIPPETRHSIRILREIRNHLTHLEVLPVRLALLSEDQDDHFEKSQ